MDDGSEIEIKAGDVAAIPPGHDAEVAGPKAVQHHIFDVGPPPSPQLCPLCGCKCGLEAREAAVTRA